MMRRVCRFVFLLCAICAGALLSAPRMALADTGDFYQWRFVDDSDKTFYFTSRNSLESIYEHESTSTGFAGNSSLSHASISDIELSGTTGGLSFSGSQAASSGTIKDIELAGSGSISTTGSLGASQLDDIFVDAFWLNGYTGSYSMYAGGTGAPNYYWNIPSFKVTKRSYGNGATNDTVSLAYHGSLKSRSVNVSTNASNLGLNDSDGFTLSENKRNFSGSIDSSSVALTDSDGYSMLGYLGARSLSLSSNASSNSAMSLCDFICSSSGNFSVTSGTSYNFFTYISKPEQYSSYLGSGSISFYQFDGLNSVRRVLFNITDITLTGNRLDITARAYNSYSGSTTDLLCSLPLHYGIGVTEHGFTLATNRQTESINSQSVTNTTNINNQSVENTDRMMNTDGSQSVLSNQLSGAQDSIESGVFGQLGSVQDTFTNVFLSRNYWSFVHFPGIVVGDITLAEPRDVSIFTGGLSQFQQPVRMICTFILFVAWFNGMLFIFRTQVLDIRDKLGGSE